MKYAKDLETYNWWKKNCLSIIRSGYTVYASTKDQKVLEAIKKFEEEWLRLQDVLKPKDVV